ncbi:hypothetical protein INR49_032464, partial [Caranx melampygus]
MSPTQSEGTTHKERDGEDITAAPPRLSRGALTNRNPVSPGNRGATSPDEERDKESDAETPCEVKTVTVSTLPVLRETSSASPAEPRGTWSVVVEEEEVVVVVVVVRVLLLLEQVVLVEEEPEEELEEEQEQEEGGIPTPIIQMSGTGEDISQVHWKQQWLENGTLYFHVSMTESELLAQTTQPTAREPAHVLHEHMHLLHISVMGGLIALLLLILLFTLVLYTRHRWCKRRRIPQKSASTEATHEIHYIPSVLLGPQGRDSYRGTRNAHQHGSSVIGMPIRETPSSMTTTAMRTNK